MFEHARATIIYGYDYKSFWSGIYDTESNVTYYSAFAMIYVLIWKQETKRLIYYSLISFKVKH